MTGEVSEFSRLAPSEPSCTVEGISWFLSRVCCVCVCAAGVGADSAAGQLMMNGAVTLMNGTGVVDMHAAAAQPVAQQPLGVHLSNVVSLGSLPSPGTVNSTKTVNSRAQAVPTSSIGGGISPALFNQVHPCTPTDAGLRQDRLRWGCQDQPQV